MIIRYFDCLDYELKLNIYKRVIFINLAILLLNLFQVMKAAVFVVVVLVVVVFVVVALLRLIFLGFLFK